MNLKKMAIIAASFLTIIFIIIVNQFNPRLGDMSWLMSPFLFIIFLLLLLIPYAIYKGLVSLIKKEEQEIKIGIITEIKKKKTNDSIDNNDMYLTKRTIANNLIEYQIVNREKRILWNVKYCLNHGEIYPSMLYVEESNEIVLQVIKGATNFEYHIKDKQSNIGSIKITNNGLIFNNLDNKPIYTATLENKYDEGDGAVADFMLSMISTSDHFYSSASKVDYFVFKDETNEIFGKYYIALKNIYLTNDTKNNFDRLIATIFSILVDNAAIVNKNREKFVWGESVK